MNEKIKTHLKAHRTEYICVGSLVAGIVIGKVVFGKATITNTVSPSFVNTVSQVTNGGYMHKIVKCLETGQMWETVKDAAEAMGVSPSMMSRHINGHRDHISDLHFSIVGLGSGS